MNKNLSYNSALKSLKLGNANFVNDELSNYLQDSIRRKDVIDAQNPYAVILTCSDSRVVPELIFDASIGELFVVRVAGNIANQSSIASIEYAVAHLNVKLIVVMGHQNCGAVTAAVKSKDGGKNLNHLLSYISPAIKATDKSHIDKITRIHARLTSAELVKQSSIIASSLKTDILQILPAFYNLDSGIVDFFE